MVSFLTDNFAPEESRLDYFIYFIRVYILFSILARDRTTLCAWIKIIKIIMEEIYSQSKVDFDDLSLSAYSINKS